MPNPFLETLSRSARNAYPAIVRGVREGLSSTRLQRALTDAGLGIRRQTLLDVMRFVRADFDAQKALAALRPDTKIRASLLPEALTRLRRTFSFTAEVRGTLLSTGKAYVQNITVSSDTLLTPRQVQELAEDLASNKKSPYGMEVDEVRFTGGRRAGVLGTL